MTGSPPAVGGSVRSRCTKCRKDTRHLVVSVVRGTPARVECTVCGGVHNYRSPGATGAERQKAPAKKAPRRVARAPSSATLEQEWRAQVEGRETDSAVPYRTSGLELRRGQLLSHATFGLGVVHKVIPPDRVEVLFRDGIRRLVSSR